MQIPTVPGMTELLVEAGKTYALELGALIGPSTALVIGKALFEQNLVDFELLRYIHADPFYVQSRARSEPTNIIMLPILSTRCLSGRA